MIRPALALALIAAALAGTAAAQPATQPTTLTVTAESRVARAPDLATITAGVITSATQAGAALSENSRRMNAVVSALKRAGIADRDMQTSSLSLQPQYRYENNRPPQLTGYQASNQVEVRLRKLDGVGPVIDALVAQGANNISGPTFTLDKPDAALDEARTEALRKARARADLYARAAGMMIARIQSISESGGFTPRPPVPMMAMARMRADAAESAPVAAGEVELTASVTVVFELH